MHSFEWTQPDALTCMFRMVTYSGIWEIRRDSSRLKRQENHFFKPMRKALYKILTKVIMCQAQGNSNSWYVWYPKGASKKCDVISKTSVMINMQTLLVPLIHLLFTWFLCDYMFTLLYVICCRIFWRKKCYWLASNAHKIQCSASASYCNFHYDD